MQRLFLTARMAVYAGVARCGDQAFDLLDAHAFRTAW
jgi:hypothetical protein